MTFLVIGQAVDGPADTVLWSSDIDDYDLFYHSSYTQLDTLTASATGVILDYTPFATVTTYVSGVGNNQLYSPQINGQLMTFGNYGGLKPITNQTSYKPYYGYNDLITAARTFNLLGGNNPYTLRVQGTVANTTISDWVFGSASPGIKYNGVSIVVNGSNLKVQDPNTLITSQYSLTNIDDFVQAINNDYDLGICPVYCISQGIQTLSGSGVTSGGVDGIMSPSNLNWVLNNVEIPPQIDSILVLDCWNDSYMPVIQSYLQNAQPIIFYFAGPGDNTTPPSQLTQISPQVCMVMGFVNVQYEVIQKRYGVECLAACLTANQTNPTNLPLTVDSFYPIYTQTQLDSLYNIGVMGLVRKIRSGVSVYKGICTDPTNSFVYNGTFARVWSLSNTYLSRYMNEFLFLGEQTFIEQNLYNLLSTVPSLNLTSVSSIVYTPSQMLTANNQPILDWFGNFLVTIITGTVDQEILSIKITLQSMK